MSYNRQDILQLIKQEENSAVEFKSCKVHPDSLAREMTAFSNSSGGVILIGVDDEGKIEGLTDERNWEEWIANIARQNVVPLVRPVYQEVRVADKRVGVVIVDKVFRELLVNACVHRNYAIHGSRIRVLMYKDRLEVISPGRLPNTVTIEKLRRGVSYAVNPVIVKFMENFRYIDKLGRGLPMVWAEAEKIGKQPVFAEFGEEFKVALPL